MLARATVSTTPSNKNSSVPTVPYMTTRIFQTQYTCSFPVTPGRKFVRLYFYPSNYANPNFVVSDSFFSVSVGPYTMLNNFNPLLTTQAMTKEFSINISSNTLNLTFTPSVAKKKAFAFVNGIEIVSMPQIFSDSKLANPPLIVGSTSTMTVDQYTALETVVRLNVGGRSMSPVNDLGLYRAWNDDEMYIYSAASGVTYPKDPNVTINYTASVPEYIAPPQVYGTARSMGPNPSLNLKYNLTWIVSVDPGFSYLIRLHFCEIDSQVSKMNMRVFDIVINNQTAQRSFDMMIYNNGGEIGVPIYRDFFLLPGMSQSEDLWIAFHPDVATKPLGYDAFLNGLEIFKLNSSDGSFTRNWRRAKKNKQRYASSLPLLPNQVRYFSSLEIRSATNDFSDSFILGVGGFGKVYRGEIDGGATRVAVKRGSRLSNQGENEFQTEIGMLSKLRHRHLRNGTIDQIIDPNLKGDISPDSLEKFVEIAERCLAGQGTERPSMGDVLWNLEIALHLHDPAEEKGESNCVPSSISSNEGMMSSIVTVDPLRDVTHL
ncbi:Receptor-like protein kinase FERONIA [Acorus calamus]|uniref:Receptor-like protein kinase FERONIA n=1 Tax=Acorus calamus TaxID=4465 RepID=A0AAV9C3P4_ACOCL|nr:Receptor-like protein kinase FERONIA [Acorus calamus]